MRRFRPTLLAVAFSLLLFLVVAAKEIFEYAALPTQDKQDDFIFPPPHDSQKLTTLTVVNNTPHITLSQSGGFANDASHLNKTPVFGMVIVQNEEQVRDALQFARKHNLKVTCAGQRHSMGGQSFTNGGLILDLKNLNRIVLDKKHKTVNVQSGARWAQVQQILDKEGLAVKAMQSINIFSVGGTLSVNAHGIDPEPGPIGLTVRSVRVMLSSGEIVKASPSENVDLFRHVVGGYGLFGVILDADLEVVDNEMYERKTVYMDYKAFPAYYAARVENREDVGLVFGRLSIAPQSFLRETALHVYTRIPHQGPLPPLQPLRQDAVDRLIINFSKTGEFGRWLRWNLEKYAEPFLHNCLTRNRAMNQKEACVVSRNEEMYDDMAYLRNRLQDTDILQEYFIPYDRMPEFVDKLREVVLRNHANLLNVTIRTGHRDTITALPYAKQDMFGFVLYFNVKFNDEDNRVLEKTTNDLIEAAQSAGGTHYLPYQLFYTKDQLLKSYPEIDDFFSAKNRYDPNGLFTNKFFEKYGSN